MNKILIDKMEELEKLCIIYSVKSMYAFGSVCTDNFNELDPVQLLKALLNEHQLKAKDLVEILGITKGTISKILSYQKGFSKEVIRALSMYFKVSQEAFNRPYKLLTDNGSPTKNVKRRRSLLSAISA
ncbi:MAG: hypothetical protein NTY32_01450 [Bacteroidia bacterium]|nr:hypothetical protein [Bacteroidia bacterium]